MLELMQMLWQLYLLNRMNYFFFSTFPVSTAPPSVMQVCSKLFNFKAEHVFLNNANLVISTSYQTNSKLSRSL